MKFLLQSQIKKYPKMQPVDLVKLLFQRERCIPATRLKTLGAGCAACTLALWIRSVSPLPRSTVFFWPHPPR